MSLETQSGFGLADSMGPGPAVKESVYDADAGRAYDGQYPGSGIPAYEAQQPPTPISTESTTSSSEEMGDGSMESPPVGAPAFNDAGDEAQNTQSTATEQHDEEAPAQAPKQRRERIRKIHLPVRDGMDELSDDEGDGSEWAQPAEGTPVPPGYDGPRRVRPEGETVRPDGKIKPSYYYPTEGSSRGVPVFEPTMEEFKDFNTYAERPVFMSESWI